MSLRSTTSLATLRRTVAGWRRQGKVIVFVPTMGALHAGHAALIRKATGTGRKVVVSLFVNPLQFGPAEDFGAYPRTLAHDRAICRAAGADLLFAPAAAGVYPEGFATTIRVAGLQDVLCGPHRPGHFDGVTTVVGKLLNMVQPDRLLLGQKDAQQAAIVGRMIQDLDFPVRLQVVPTVRERDGLALSSRNRYLSPAERAVAPALYAALRRARTRIRAGERGAARLIAGIEADLAAAPPFRLQYAEIVAAETLRPLARLSGRVLVAAAAHLGRARLIDNIIMTVPGDGGRRKA